MKRSQHPKEPVRAFIRHLPGCSAAFQRRHLDKIDAAPAIYDAAKDDARQSRYRDTWIATLSGRRPGWVYRASLIAETAASVESPTQDYLLAVFDLGVQIGRGAVVRFGSPNVGSDDRAAFREALAHGYRQIASGRRVTSNEMRRRGAKGSKANEENSGVNRLKTDLKPHAKVLAAIWRDRVEYPTEVAAAEAVTAYLEEHGLRRVGSGQTLRKMFGGRTN